MDNKEQIIAGVLVDLYEMRASVLSPLQARQMEKVENLFQYNFISVIISQLQSKYKIKDKDIKEAIRNRHINNLVPNVQ